MLARQVTLRGPAEALTDNKVNLAASMFNHFARQPGHCGGHLLVKQDQGLFSATSFWETAEAMNDTIKTAESAAARMCTTIWGKCGAFEIDTFEVVGLKPCSVEIGIPDAP